MSAPLPADPAAPLSNAAAAAAGDAMPCAAVSAAPRLLRISSKQLFGTATELQIEHRGALYRLKQTALGKLILTK